MEWGLRLLSFALVSLSISSSFVESSCDFSIAYVNSVGRPLDFFCH